MKRRTGERARGSLILPRSRPAAEGAPLHLRILEQGHERAGEHRDDGRARLEDHARLREVEPDHFIACHYPLWGPEAPPEAGIPVEGTISSAFGDAYEGEVPPQKVAEVSVRMHELGIGAISYGDTTGMGTPRRVREVVEALRASLPALSLNMHFHDTRGTGLANVVAALDLGIDYFDSSIGGMGGSPFASGSTGNIATEDLVHMLTDMGIETGVDLDKLLDAGRVAQSLIEGELPSKVLKAGPRWRVTG